MVWHPFILTIMSWPLDVASASGVPPSKTVRLQPALHGSKQVKSPRHIPMVASYCNCLVYRVLPPSSPPINCLEVLLQPWSIMAECISTLAWLWPPSASLSSLDLGLQVHLPCRSIMASNWISELTLSRPQSASPNWLHHGLQVHLGVQLILASKCISNNGWLRRPSVSRSLLDLGLQMNVQTRSIAASNSISEFIRSQPPSASPNSLNHGL